MNTTDYKEAATALRSLRVEMLMRHALRPPSQMSRQKHFNLWVHVLRVLTYHELLRAPWSTTHDILRQNRETILNH